MRDNGDTMDTKKQIESIVREVTEGTIDPEIGWSKIQALKESYFAQYNSQSWNSFVGNKFQQMIITLILKFITELKASGDGFTNLRIFTESEIKDNDILSRKVAVKYGEFLLLPDTDAVIVWMDNANQWNSEILAVVSCKTSLRERIAQSCYWKLKFLSSDVTKGIKVLLTTSDNDDDFIVKPGPRRYNDLSRNRVIAEHELDGIYVLGKEFKAEWESNKIRRFSRLFEYLSNIRRG